MIISEPASRQESSRATASGTCGLRTQNILLTALPGILLAIACLIPYLNKAYTIDDPWFVLEAEQILKTPLQPLSFDVCWMGNETCTRAAILGAGSRQALMGYVLVPVVLLGGQEWIAHLMQMVVACLASLSMVRLALRLGYDHEQAALAGLMLAAIPPMLVMASTVMPDTVAIALGISGFERLLAWRDEHRRRDGMLAALLLGLAPFARPHLTLLLPLGTLWLIREFRIAAVLTQLRRGARLWVPIVIAGCILMAVTLTTQDRGVKPAIQDSMVSWTNVPRNLLSYLQYLAYPIPFAAVWLGVRWRKRPVLLALPGLAVVMLHLFTDPDATLFERWPFIASAYGLTALVNMLNFCWRRPDWTQRLLSLWILLPVPVVIYTHMPMKYMVGVMPAVILILLRALEELPRARAMTICRSVVVVCVAFSCVLLRADADFAEYGRRAAAELIAPRVRAGERVWYGAGQWGFYWYAREAGARVSVPGEPGPLSGELLAVGLVEGGGSTLKRFPNRELVDSRAYGSPHGRTMGYGGALYSNSCGDAPWIWKPEATNVYQLWRVK